MPTTIEIQLFNFNELSDKLKEKVIEKHRNFEVELYDWYDFMYEDWKAKLISIGFENPSIYFSGFYNQGDGACFDCTQFNITSLTKALGYDPVKSTIIEIINPEITIEKRSNGSHENTRYINCNFTMLPVFSAEAADIKKILSAPLEELPTLLTDDLSEEERICLEARLKYSAPAINLENIYQEFIHDLEDLRKDLSKQIYNDLKEEFRTLTSDEHLKEVIQEQGWKFLKNGELWEG